jgi:3-hydroxybutyryl-CoA dehydrogenase
MSEEGQITSSFVSPFQTIGVIGSGQMGAGIAYVCVKAGLDVILYEPHAQSIEKGLHYIQKCFDKEGIEPVKVPHVADTLKDLALCDLIIEAIPEDYDLKRDLFKQLDVFVKEQALFATNTSSMSIRNLSEGLSHCFIGIHFMNPVPKLPLVEIIHHERSKKETIHHAQQFVHFIQKKAILVKDSPAFVVNRLLLPMINTAVNLVQSNVSTIQDIDKAMTLGAHHPLGPLALADLIGIDTCVFILHEMCAELGACYQPAAMLEDMVKKGYLGRKTQKGFYNYDSK